MTFDLLLNIGHNFLAEIGCSVIFGICVPYVQTFQMMAIDFKHVTFTLNQSIPNKVVTIRPRDLPWIHNEIRTEISKRNRMHQLAKNTNTPENWKLYLGRQEIMLHY